MLAFKSTHAEHRSKTIVVELCIVLLRLIIRCLNKRIVMFEWILEVGLS